MMQIRIALWTKTQQLSMAMFPEWLMLMMHSYLDSWDFLQLADFVDPDFQYQQVWALIIE